MENNRQHKEYDLERLRQGLRRYADGTLTKSKNGFYVCPFPSCNSGEKAGGKGTGAFRITDDGLKWKCFSCRRGGDIFDLIGEIENLQEFPDQVERAAEILHEKEITRYTKKTDITMFTEKTKVTRKTENTKGRYLPYLTKCAENVAKTDYWSTRGFTPETVTRFFLGYDPEKQCAVIPYGRDGSYFITRDTKTAPNEKEGREIRKPRAADAGPEPVYNAGALNDKAPCFVCESPIDAISIMQAGGKAVSIGGTGAEKLLRRISEKPAECRLILALDNDDPGREGTQKLVEGLEEAGARYIVASFTQDVKDANDMLRADADLLAADVRRIIDEAERADSADLNEQKKIIISRSGGEILDRIEKRGKEGTFPEPISTGFSNLDKIMDGGLYPKLHLLGAVSSIGKSAFVLQLADNLAMTGTPVLFFALEMSQEELVARSISRLSYLVDPRCAKTERAITRGSTWKNMSEKETAVLDEAMDRYAAYGSWIYFYEGRGDMTVLNVREEVERYINIMGGMKPVVFVDYVQILEPVDVRGTDKTAMDRTMKELKQLSRDFELPVIAVSSFNRGSYNATVKQESFKESGSAEYGADVLMGLQPQEMRDVARDDVPDFMEKHKGEAVRRIELVIIKQRGGRGTGKAGFVYQAAYNYFEPDTDYADD